MNAEYGNVRPLTLSEELEAESKTMKQDPKVLALAQFLEMNLDEEELTPESDGCLFIVGRCEYLVLTDEEADERAGEAIKESLWAFRPEFLAAHSEADQQTFELLQATGKCESLNPTFEKLIADLDHFIGDAIDSDGRGHFINSYDGEECEAKVNGQWFFIYQVQ
jgi:hypothetical protein